MNVVLLEVSLMNFIVRISKEIKCKVKVVFLKVSLTNLILWISKEIKAKVNVVLLEIAIIDELHSWHIQGDQMEGQSGVTRSVIE